MNLYIFLIKLILICLGITYIYGYTTFIDDLAKILKKILVFSSKKATFRTEKSTANSPMGSKNYKSLTNFNNNYVSFNKPFGCYSCMCFWISFLYSLIYFNIIYAFAIGLFCHLFSRVLKKLLGYLIDMIEKI